MVHHSFEPQADHTDFMGTYTVKDTARIKDIMQQNHINKISDEDLIAAFNKTPHLGKLKAILKLPEITIWRRLNRLNLKCMTRDKSSIDLNEILSGMHPYYQTFKLNKRLIKENILENKCSCCGIDSWLGERIGLHLDHIDGDNSNHVLENLRLLCPNCHSQTDTYCGKNKIKGVHPC